MILGSLLKLQLTASPFYRQEVADAAKVLEQGDTTPKIMGDEKETASTDVEAKAPPSTPTKKTSSETAVDGVDTAAEEENKAKKNRRRSESFDHFPKFRVTWDSTVPSLMSLRSPGKRNRRNSHTAMSERPSILMYVVKKRFKFHERRKKLVKFCFYTSYTIWISLQFDDLLIFGQKFLN